VVLTNAPPARMIATPTLTFRLDNIIMDWYIYPLLLLGGLIAGFINTLAGSGSLITLPILIFAGLPATVANGTNRVGILLQSAVAVKGFHYQKKLNFKEGFLLALPAVLGSLIGAQVAVELNEQLMKQIIGILMLLMVVILLFQPKRWLEGHQKNFSSREGKGNFFVFAGKIMVFFLIGLYGGFIQAGVGVFLLAGLVMAGGYDVVRANAVKVLVILCFTVLALGVFILNDQVRWDIGLVLGAGNMTGAWLGTRTAAKRGAKFVRWLLIAVVTVSGILLLANIR
jgi:uncharacterized protein